MKVARASVRTQARSIPALRFADQQMTSYGGLVIFEHLFDQLNLYERLAGCCAHLKSTHCYSYATVLRCLLIHLLIGARRLREMDFYRQDPLVLHVSGLRQLPSVPTVSRMLREFDPKSVEQLQRLNRDIVLERCRKQDLTTVTLDFDGSVQSTKRHAEGTAVGFNKQKKGARSYYPLFCTVAQSGQALDVLHRSGNVHDSNGAVDFVRRCVEAVRGALPRARIEARLDSAFFSDAMIGQLESLGVEFTISVPFERFVALKKMITGRWWWNRVPGSDGASHCFERRWKPQSWAKRSRFIFIRSRVAVQNRAPVQLDLFAPVEQGFEFKVIVTNKTTAAGRVARFHEGRGYQEKVFSEMKSQAQMGYIPCRRRTANEIYLLSSMLVHNLGRELQMEAVAPARAATVKRTVQWIFEELGTLRRTIIQRAGRLSRPQGRLTLTLPNIPALQNAIQRFLPA